MPPVAKRVLLFGILPLSLTCAVVFGIGSVYASSFTNKIYPGVFVGGLDVGGLTEVQAAVKISSATEQIMQNGLALSIENNLKTIPLTSDSASNPDTSYDFLIWDVDSAVREAMQAGRTGTVTAVFAPLSYGVGFHHTIALPTTLDEAHLTEAINLAFPEINTPAVDAGFSIASVADQWSVAVIASHDGQIIETASLFQNMRQQLSAHLSLPPLSTSITRQTAAITTQAAEQLVAAAKSALESAPYTLTFSPPDAEPNTWPISAQDLASYLEPTLDTSHAATVGINSTFITVIQERTKNVIIPPKDAKFAITNGKVTEFQSGGGGWVIQEEETLQSFEDALHNAYTEVPITALWQDSAVQTQDVNDLGITEILGVGESNFSGSPANRIKNIQNGVNLLNGTLIKAGEAFSLLAALGPFTEENGYFSELVIKGDKITPELGGGLCQIGTTTFRGAMNAGLEIVERRNHSLVVSYYNDPRNKLPGTDATIYDPSPDLKLLNNTGNAVLITTDMNTETGALAFSFWGTSDGRKASYSEPIVSNWIPAGTTRNIETLSLAPGTTKCQAKHPGANASFVYTIVNADGTTTEQTFTSSYRALPEICLVGVEALSTDVPVTDEIPTDPTSSESAPTETSTTPEPTTVTEPVPVVTP